MVAEDGAGAAAVCRTSPDKAVAGPCRTSAAARSGSSWARSGSAIDDVWTANEARQRAGDLSWRCDDRFDLLACAENDPLQTRADEEETSEDDAYLHICQVLPDTISAAVAKRL